MNGNGFSSGFAGALWGSILVALITFAPPALKAVTIRPTVDGSVRDGLYSPKDGIPDVVIEGSIVQALNINRPVMPFEDRGIIEFNITDLATNAPLMLHLPVFGDMGPFPFTISVYTYAGDGSLTLGDFNAGSLFTSFTYFGGSSVDLDVTSVIRGLQSKESVFAGFNFRFTVPSNIDLNGPFIAFNSLEFGPPATISDQDVTVPESGSTFVEMICSILVLAALANLFRRS